MTDPSSTLAAPDADEPAARSTGAPSPAALTLGFPEGEPQPLDPRFIDMELVGNWIFSGLLAAGGLITVAATSRGGWRLFLIGLTLAIVAGICWWGRRWAYLQHARTSYTVSPAGCEIRRGVVWRRIVNVPRSRIQHTDVTQGPLERAYGLSTLVLYTAGTEHAKIELSGITFDRAMAIRRYLVEGTDDDRDRSGGSGSGASSASGADSGAAGHPGLTTVRDG